MKLINYVRAVLLVGSFLFCNSMAFSANPPIKVDAKGDRLRAGQASFPVWRYTITSLDDNITLQSLVLNRGNCVISTNDRGNNMNARLKFGQSYTFTTPSNHPILNANHLN